jgi:hypothetical protein
VFGNLKANFFSVDFSSPGPGDLEQHVPERPDRPVGVRGVRQDLQAQERCGSSCGRQGTAKIQKFIKSRQVLF